MLRYIDDDCGYEVAPQAIFWRPLRYFTPSCRHGSDDLDAYAAATYLYGNEISFELRVYAGHPRQTTTVYLPFHVQEFAAISDAVKVIVRALAVPTSAVAWRRGQDFEFGKLSRPPTDRLREAEARILALKIASEMPGQRATTTQVKQAVPEYLELSPEDRKPSATRRTEERWHQILGNVVSHGDTPRGLFARGLASRTPRGLQVTQEGVAYLKSIGFGS